MDDKDYKVLIKEYEKFASQSNDRMSDSGVIRSD